MADAYLVLTWHNGVMADVAFANGGGIRSTVEAGKFTYGDIINVQPFNNQLCYVETLGQNILDALKMSVRNLPEASGGFQQVAGLSFIVLTDLPSPVQLENGMFSGIEGERRVRNAQVDGRPLDAAQCYKVVSIQYMLVEGGDGMTMFQGDDAMPLDLDNATLIEHLQYNLGGVIGSECADQNGQGRIRLLDGP